MPTNAIQKQKKVKQNERRKRSADKECIGRHTQVVEEHRIWAEAVPKGAVDCIGERMLA